MKNIILFASGNGSNAENICQYFANHTSIKVVALICNKQDAGVVDRLKKYNIATHIVSKKILSDADVFLPLIQQYKPNLLVLAGWLLLVPAYLITHYPKKIINLHPALLPKYGGKGMYGKHVHTAVKNNRDNETGITIHFANEKFDEGEIVFQAKTKIVKEDTVEDIALKIAFLEKKYLPIVIEKLVS